MLKHASLASLLALSLSACGSAVVMPNGPGDAAAAADSPSAADVSVAADAGRPPQGDAGLADVAAPPVDAGPATVSSLCRLACARQARQCGGGSQDCEVGCASIERAPGSERCQGEIRSALSCLVDVGFVCRGMRGEVPPACAPLFSAVQRCTGGGTPPTDPDAGPPPMTLPAGCEAYCAFSERSCGSSDPSCRPNCAQSVGSLSPVCQVRFDDVVGCITVNRPVCQRGLAQPSDACRTQLDAFRPCGMSATTDGGTVPPPDDAGTDPDPVPVDAGGPDV